MCVRDYTTRARHDERRGIVWLNAVVPIISLVKPCPDSYTGIRRAEIMLKVEPANHPFVVCMRHVIPGGDDKSDFSAYFVPLYILEGLCLHLAGISGAGEHTFVPLVSASTDFPNDHG